MTKGPITTLQILISESNDAIRTKCPTQKHKQKVAALPIWLGLKCESDSV
jgi:hypothetical protein